MRSVLTLICLALVLTGCGSDKPDPVVRREGEPPVSSVESDDAEMNAAIQKAKDSLDMFIKRLQKPKPGESFLVKAGLSTPDDSLEHIWLDNATYRDGVFEGVIDNEPLNLPNVKFGQRVKVDRAQITDWMIGRQDKKKGLVIEGGFTSEVLMNRDGGSPKE